MNKESSQKAFPEASKKCRGMFFTLKPLLFILSVLYLFFVTIRQIAYRCNIFKSFRLDAVVISVGNITWGGTGKTPLVIALANFFKKTGRRVAISTRGYGGDYVKSGIVVGPKPDNIKEKGFLGDEVYLFKDYLKGVPLIVGKNRYALIKEAFKREKTEVLILDDGFQHLKLKRDLDIIVINGLNPFGNYRLVPLGILREPLSSLRRADILVINKADLAENLNYTKGLLKKINPRALIVCSRHFLKGVYEPLDDTEVNISELKGRNIALLCAIGDPDSFEKLLKNNGLVTKTAFRFIDHHKFNTREIERVINICLKDKIDVVITTDKDITRLKGYTDLFKGTDIKLLFTRIELEFTENSEAFFERLSALSVS